MSKKFTFKTILIFSFLGLGFNAKSQTYTFTPGTTFTINMGFNDLQYDGIEWTNNSNQTIIFHWQKIEEDTTGGSYFDMCASGNCYIGIPDTGSFNVYPTLAGQIGWLKFHFWSGNIPGISKVKMYIYETSAPSNGDTLLYILNVNQNANGIAQNNLNPDLTVYPNPANEKLFIDITNRNSDETLYAFIINSIGQTIYSEELNHLQNNISLTTLSEGIYILQLTNKRKEIIHTKKIIINHR